MRCKLINHYSIIKDLTLRRCLETSKIQHSVLKLSAQFPTHHLASKPNAESNNSILLSQKAYFKTTFGRFGGGEGVRTPDLRLAKPALCQTELHPQNPFGIGCGGRI